MIPLFQQSADSFAVRGNKARNIFGAIAAAITIPFLTPGCSGPMTAAPIKTCVDDTRDNCTGDSSLYEVRSDDLLSKLFAPRIVANATRVPQLVTTPDGGQKTEPVQFDGNMATTPTAATIAAGIVSDAAKIAVGGLAVKAEQDVANAINKQTSAGNANANAGTTTFPGGTVGGGRGSEVSIGKPTITGNNNQITNDVTVVRSSPGRGSWAKPVNGS